MFWLIIAVLLFIAIVVNQCSYYFTYPTKHAMNIVTAESLEFPVVTICNHNAHRLTKAHENSLYQYLTDYYSNSDTVDASAFPNDALLEKMTHQREDLIIKASFNGKPVDQAYWKQTEDGGCIIFNDVETPLTIEQPGPRNGLSLTINMEAYEYMAGPLSTEGVQVSLSEPDEKSLGEPRSFPISPGYKTMAAINTVQHLLLAPPYGDCAYMDEERNEEDCMEKYNTKVQDECKCEVELCSTPTQMECMGKINKPVCAKPCESTIYKTERSDSRLSASATKRSLSASVVTKLEGKLSEALAVMDNYGIRGNANSQVNDQFIMENILQLDLYMDDLRLTKHEQTVAFSINDLFGSFGTWFFLIWLGFLGVVDFAHYVKSGRKGGEGSADHAYAKRNSVSSVSKAIPE